MNWPWVSRAALEAAQQALDDERMHRKFDQEFWSGVVRTMLDVQKPHTPPVPDRPKPDPIMQAVATVAGTDGRLREHLASWVKAERRKPDGMSDDAILDKLWHWDDSSDDANPDTSPA